MNTQNLNERGSMFWHGRASVNRFKCEWNIGRKATFCHAYVELEDEGKLLLSFGLPWLFAIWLTVYGLKTRKKTTRVGVAIHNQSAWLYLFDNPNESRSNDPWYRKSHAWSFPWAFDRCVSEVLEHKAFLLGLQKTVWTSANGKTFLEGWDERQAAQVSVSETYDYTYTRKNGEIQRRKATVYVERRTWKMKWWPLLPFKKSDTSIWVNFDEEIGEGVGSWKGGTTGCGWSMLPGETPLMTLRRMESTRKFSR